jgi:glycosyltransferase involved in cell wall biosynthesis
MYDYVHKLAESCTVYVLAPLTRGALRKETEGKITIYRHSQFLFSGPEIAYGSGIMPNLKRNPLLYVIVPFFLLFQFFALFQIIRQHNIQVIHAQWLIPQGLVAIIYKKLLNYRIPVITTVHGGDIWGLQGRIGTTIKQFIIKMSDSITAQSNPIKQEIEHLVPSAKPYVYPFCVDVSVFSPNKKSQQLRKQYAGDNALLLFVGTLTERKGIDHLIRSLPLIRKTIPHVTLLIVGTGEWEKKMKALAHQLGVENNTIFAGPVSHTDLPPYYASSDIFILPSLSEGFPLVVMEAMSSGTIPIVSDLPIFTDIQKQCPFLYIVKKKNPQDIADTVISLITNKKNVPRLKEKARAYAVENFNLDLQGKNYYNLIYRLSNS